VGSSRWALEYHGAVEPMKSRNAAISSYGPSPRMAKVIALALR